MCHGGSLFSIPVVFCKLIDCNGVMVLLPVQLVVFGM